MKRALICLCAAALTLGIAPAVANHNGDEHKGKMRKRGTFNQSGKYRTGTDLAFWGDLAVLGNYDNPGGFRLMDISDPDKPKLISQFECPGSQADVSIWEELVFVSVDSPRTEATCGAGGAGTAQVAQGTHWEGIRVVSIENPRKPVQIAAVDTDCGSHTHTLIPDLDNDRLLIYVSSYPLGGQGVECNLATHRKISVVEVPLETPERARVIATPSVSPAIGCHDITVLMSKRMAAAACISESQIWDITDLTAPRIVSRIVNPLINIHHSSAWSWDGRTIVIGDELGGAAVTPGCFTEGHAPLGALWFYDVTNPASPQRRGSFQTSNQEASLFCTAHNFNVVPLRTDDDILVTGWYNGGSIVVDFTDPAEPRELALYAPKDGGQTAAWSTYWYNGAIYSNNFDEDVNSISGKSRGFDVFAFEDAVVASAIELGHLNPQTQEILPAAEPAAEVKGTRFSRDVLPRTGASPWTLAGLIVLSAAAVLTRWTRAQRV